MSQRYKGGIVSATPPTTNATGYGSASGTWTLQQQMQLKNAGTWPGPFTPVETVFSTNLYNGNGSSQTITNNINLSGEGGLVWIKRRSPSDTSVVNHCLTDTARGNTKYISSDTNSADTTRSDTITSFNNNGFSIGGADIVNKSSDTVVAWTFRKAPKFFDVVTYAGNGASNRAINHNLGSVPGCIIIKAYSGTQAAGSNWVVYHRSLGTGKAIRLNFTAGEITSSLYFPTTPTSTQFYVSDDTVNFNATGTNYVAYLFAHDAGGYGVNNDQNIVSCGTFTSSTSTNVNVSLGYEPQWILMKATSTSSAWFMLDNMRGMANTTDTGADKTLLANSSAAEDTTNYSGVYPTSTGFIVNTNFSSTQIGNGVTMVYVAIRRGPMAFPTSGTSVYTSAYGTGSSNPAWISGFPIDMAVDANIGGGSTDEKNLSTRLGQQRYLVTNTDAAEAAYSAELYSYQNGFRTTNNGTSDFAWMFRRSPGFFDYVYYTGNGGTQTITHNLGVTPDFIIFKNRALSDWWTLSSAFIDGGSGAAGYGVANSNNIIILNSATTITNGDFMSASPTSSTLSFGSSSNVNANNNNYIALLFASLPGISKVGSYLGTGATLQVNCGFTSGVRFLMIRRMNNANGDWFVWDSTRGIGSGNDPYTLWNTSGGQVTSDWVDTYSAGFVVNASGDVNFSGSTYFYFAIA